MSLSTELFSEFHDGRLKRRRFLICAVIAFIAPFFLILLTLTPFLEFLITIENTTQDIRYLKIGMILIKILFIFLKVLFFYASINIEAKRFRDMGLPGWWMVILHYFIIAVIVAIAIFIEDDVLNYDMIKIIYLLLGLCLLFIPTDFFCRKK